MKKNTYHCPCCSTTVITDSFPLLAGSQSGPSATFMSSPGVQEYASRTYFIEDDHDEE